MFTQVHLCLSLLLVLVYLRLPIFTWVCLLLPMFTHVYPCFFYVQQCLITFTYVYLCSLMLDDIIMWPCTWKGTTWRRKNFWVFCAVLQARRYWPHWWRFHLLGTSRCLVTVLQSQDTPKLIIGEKRVWIINLNFCISPCKVNKMSSSSLQCMPCCFGALHGSNNSRHETGSCDSCVVSSVGWVRMWLGRATRFYLEQRYVSEWLTYYKHGDDCPLT